MKKIRKQREGAVNTQVLITAGFQKVQPSLLSLLFLSIALKLAICVFHGLVSYITQSLKESRAVITIRGLTDEDTVVQTAELTCPSLYHLAALQFKPW